MILKIIKGVVVGIAALIPGVSAGSMIMSMGTYGSIISLVAGDKRTRRDMLRALWPFGVGILVGLFAFSFVITFVRGRFPLQTAMVFIGLILGGIPVLVRRVRRQKPTVWNILAFVIMVGLMVLMMVFSRRAGAALSLQPSVLHFILTIFVGFVAVATMIVPGISGSAVMLIIGYYNELTGRLKELATAFATLDGPAILENVLVFVPFLIGAALAVVFVTRGIKKLVEKHPVSTYYAIIGLMVASPITVLAKLDSSVYLTVKPLGVGLCVVCLIAGFAAAMLLSSEDDSLERPVQNTDAADAAAPEEREAQTTDGTDEPS